jgi:hypothetical protein
VSFAAISICVASQRVFIVVCVYFVIDSVRKLVDIPLCCRKQILTYISCHLHGMCEGSYGMRHGDGARSIRGPLIPPVAWKE